MRYRKLPVEIEAFQYDGDVISFEACEKLPQWFINARQCGIAVLKGGVLNCPICLYIKTLEGEMMVSIGDYIIKGINDELYPCKPDIFEKTYEAVT